MSATLLAASLAAATIAWLARRWRSIVQEWGAMDWLGAGVLLVGIATFWLRAVSAVSGSVFYDWSGARLAPTFALVYGYGLYYPATEGPILNHIYGPLAALAYLPATVFRTPTTAILAAATLQMAGLFAALLFYARCAGRRRLEDEPLALAAGLGACLLMSRYAAGAYWLESVHVDGPALVLGLMACVPLASPQKSLGRGGALASATLAVLAFWTKQTTAPLLLALPLAVWVERDRASARRYVLILGASAAVISALFVLWFGRPMLFNMFSIASGQPWQKPGLTGLLATASAFAGEIWELVAVLALALAIRRRRTAAALGARAWLAPLIVAVALLPTGILGANKFGGASNSFHSLYYLLAALAALVAEIGQREPRLRSLAWALCLLGAVASWRAGRVLPPPVYWLNNGQLAYEFARRHPGEAYFPWQPLSELLAEGSLYHFEYGVIDRAAAGFVPSRRHFRAHIPPNLRYVATRSLGPTWTERYFRGYEQTTHPELPGWVVLRRR